MDKTILSAPNTIVSNLGLELLPPDGPCPEVVRASMPVDHRTCQPFGYLSGGASLALAETLAGYGSVLNLPEIMKPVGSSITAQHVRPVPLGGSVHGTATLLHKGHTTHLWNVDIVDDEGRLISTARVLNQIVQLTH